MKNKRSSAVQNPPVIKSVREVRLTVRISDEDKARIQRLRSLLSPYSPLSEGKTISAALELAEKYVKK